MPSMPQELVTARLFCLNKEATHHGSVDYPRPIAIASTMLKIIEGLYFR